MKFEKWRKSVDTDYTSFGRGLGVRSCTHLEAATSSPPDYSNIEKPQYYLYRMKGSRASLQNKQSFHLSSSPTCSTMSIRQWVRAMKSKQPIIKTKALRGNNKTKQWKDLKIFLERSTSFTHKELGRDQRIDMTSKRTQNNLIQIIQWSSSCRG